jgi:hypothetical protein
MVESLEHELAAEQQVREQAENDIKRLIWCHNFGEKNLNSIIHDLEEDLATANAAREQAERERDYLLHCCAEPHLCPPDQPSHKGNCGGDCKTCWKDAVKRQDDTPANALRAAGEGERQANRRFVV